MAAHRQVERWLAKYENPMKPVVLRIREIVLGADARIGECIKWQAPTFTYEGNLASFFRRSKQHASLMFHRGASIPGAHPRLEGGGETGRFLKIASVAEANAARKDIENIVRAWRDWKDERPGPPRTPTKPSARAKVKPTPRSHTRTRTAAR